MIDIAKASVDELQARFTELGKQMSEISVERVAIDDELVRRKRDVSVWLRVDAMSEDEKAAFRRALDV